MHMDLVGVSLSDTKQMGGKYLNKGDLLSPLLHSKHALIHFVFNMAGTVANLHCLLSVDVVGLY